MALWKLSSRLRQRGVTGSGCARPKWVDKCRLVSPETAEPPVRWTLSCLVLVPFLRRLLSVQRAVRSRGPGGPQAARRAGLGRRRRSVHAVGAGRRAAAGADGGPAASGRRCESGRWVSSNAPAGALRAESRRTRSGARQRPRARTGGAAVSPPQASGRRRSAITATTVLPLTRQYRSCRSAVIGASRRSPMPGKQAGHQFGERRPTRPAQRAVTVPRLGEPGRAFVDAARKKVST
jgi:hypothetical protein